MAIDDPLGRIRQIANEDDNDPLGVALSIAAPTLPFLGILSAVKEALSGHQQGHRMRVAIIALADEIERLQNRWPKDMNALFESDWFKKMVKALLKESADATTQEKAATLAKAAAHGCFPDEHNAYRQEDLASYIYDLAQLGTNDIQMLKLLKEAYADAIRVLPNLHDPNYFTEHFQNFKKLANERQIHPDDCIALEARLSGFGLAIEVERNSSRQSPGEYCFRPTKRGLYLLSLLEAAEAPIERQH